MNIYMNLTFIGVDGFEKYRPIVDVLLKNLSEKSLINFTMAINEAICNALRYGDGGLDLSKVKLKFRYNGKHIIAKISSNSPGFDIQTYIHSFDENTSDWWTSIKNRNHGRGLWIMLSGSKKVIFSSDGNEVTLVTEIADTESIEEGNLLSKVYVRKC